MNIPLQVITNITVKYFLLVFDIKNNYIPTYTKKEQKNRFKYILQITT